MLTGYVDLLQPTIVGGWAADTDQPEAIVEVAIYLDEVRVATVACDRPRPDLQSRAVLRGHTQHGFRFEFSSSIGLDWLRGVTVRFARTGAILTDGLRAGGRRNLLAPILVTAPGRSGTTFLMNRLSASPRVCLVGVPPFEVRLLSYWASAYRVLTAGPDFSRSTNPAHLEGDGFKVGSNPFSHADYANAFSERDLALEYYNRFVPETAADMMRSVIEEYYLRLCDNQGKRDVRYFAEKGNNIHRPTRMISRILYPDLKEIIIIRDPRDLYCSHIAYFRQGSERAFKDISYACEELLRIWKNRTDREIFVRYEDMIRDSSETFGRLSKFLDVPDLDHGNTDREDAVFQVHATSKSPQDSIGRWREMSMDDQRRFETAWGELIREFGYEI